MTHTTKALLALAFAAIMGVTGCTDAGGAYAKAPTDDGWRACKHWRNVAQDIEDGVLTTIEAKRKIAEVRDSTNNPDVHSAAAGLLVALNQGARGDTFNAVLKLEKACAGR